MKTSRQAGFTLVEVVVVLALLGVILTPVAAILFQLIWIPGQWADTFTALHNARQAVRWITGDARQATSFTPGTNPNYGTFSWVDRSSNPATTYTARYYYSAADTSLKREVTGGGSPETVIIADKIQSYGDISLQESSGLVLVSVTTTVESTTGTLTRTATARAKMRPVLPAAVPTPPPYTLAWDDFESGEWTGGTGWLDDWYHTGASSIRSDGTPYEGTYHLRLQSSTGYVDRALNLAGQIKVRLQFWAKASSFEPGETVVCQVSHNGTTWYTVRTWVDGEDDGIYRFVDIDLSSYTMSSEFWIAFDAGMSDTGDYFWVDDLKVVRTW